jgi:AcrR family transcriptional regulator
MGTVSPSSTRPEVTRSPDEPAEGPRAAGKRRTRARLLQAAFGLLVDRGFEGLSLRQVAREAGIAPAALYRHFADADELGLALVDESVAALHASIRAARADSPRGLSAATSAGIVLEYVRTHRDRFRFLSRERRGGSPVLRAAIGRELALFERDLALDLMRDPVVRTWPSEDVRLLAGMLVGLMADAVDELLAAGTPEAEAAAADRARRRLALLRVGIGGWAG